MTRRKDDSVLCRRPDCGGEIARRKAAGAGKAHLVLRPGYVPDRAGLWRIGDVDRERRYQIPRPGHRRGQSYENVERVMWDDAPGGRRARPTKEPPPPSAPMGWSPATLPIDIRCWRCSLVQPVDPVELAVVLMAGSPVRLHPGTAYPMAW